MKLVNNSQKSHEQNSCKLYLKLLKELYIFESHSQVQTERISCHILVSRILTHG